jgi:hypothetical protein
MEDVQPIKLGFHFFQSFCEYESGQMDARTLAKEMIQAFFKQDFPSERCVLGIHSFLYGDDDVYWMHVGMHTLGVRRYSMTG